jgi:transposase InsO family protein
VGPEPVYGADKIWAQLNRGRITVARCTVERLMRALGVKGVIRGKRHRTTMSDPARERPRDLVERAFSAPAPNRLCLPHITYVRTW